MDADSDLIAADLDDRDLDVFADLNRFAGAACQDEHGNPSVDNGEVAMLAQLAMGSHRMFVHECARKSRLDAGGAAGMETAPTRVTALGNPYLPCEDRPYAERAAPRSAGGHPNGEGDRFR